MEHIFFNNAFEGNFSTYKGKFATLLKLLYDYRGTNSDYNKALYFILDDRQHNPVSFMHFDIWPI